MFLLKGLNTLNIMSSTQSKNIESEIAENQNLFLEQEEVVSETHNLPQNNSLEIKIDNSVEENNSTNNNMSSAKMTSKKLCAEMFFTNPTEYDIKVFKYLNGYTKQQLITYIIPYFLGNMTTKEYCEEHLVNLKPKKTTKKKVNSIPKPSCKYIYKALDNFDKFSSSNQKLIKLCDNTIFGIQFLKHPYENEVFMIADFQTLHITTEDKNKKVLKTPTIKHYISIVNELGKSISKIDNIKNMNGYGEPFQKFINSILNHYQYDEEDFIEDKITIAQLDTYDTFRKILRKEKSYNNTSTYINNFLHTILANKDNPLSIDSSFKCKYLYNNTLFDIVNLDMFVNDNSIYGCDYWDKYTDYTGNITLDKKDEFVENYNVYENFINIDTNNYSDSNSETNSNNTTEEVEEVEQVEDKIYIEFNKKDNIRYCINKFDPKGNDFGLEFFQNEDKYDLSKYTLQLLEKDKPTNMPHNRMRINGYDLYDKKWFHNIDNNKWYRLFAKKNK